MEIETQEVLIRVNGEDEERVAVFGLIPDDYEGDLADLPDDEGIYYWLTRQEWESLKVGDEYGDAVITRVGEGEDFGYFVEDEMLICSPCADNPLYYGLLTVAEAEGYPDGYTCAHCGEVVEGEGKR
jgi:hypothetical protein